MTLDDLDIDALQAIIDAAREKKAAKKPRPTKTTRQYWEEWEPFAEAREDWKVIKSAKPRLLDMKIVIDGKTTCLGDLTPDETGAKAIAIWRLARSKQITIRGKPTKAAGRDREVSCLQAMFTWHVEAKHLPSNPLAGLPRERKKGHHREGYFQSDEQFEAFLRTAHPLFAKMARLSYRCGGLRRDEVRLLTDQHVDWDRREIVIKGEDHKNDNKKTVPLTDDAFEMLCAQMAVSRPHPDGSRYLFPNPRDPLGGPVPMGTIDGWNAKAKRNCGFNLLGESPTFHHLRHTWAMHMLEKGAALPWVMEVAGWKSLDVAKRYMGLVGTARETMRGLMNDPLPEKRRGPQKTATMRAANTVSYVDVKKAK